jgi:hypothetical protein
MANNQNVVTAEERATARKLEILNHLSSDSRTYVLSAAPGSGKSYLLLDLAKSLVGQGKRVIVAANTNNQATNLLMTWMREYKGAKGFIRLASKSAPVPADAPLDRWYTSYKDIPDGPIAVVSTSSYLSIVCANEEEHNFSYLFMEEAYQVTWAKFMQISGLASRTLFIGDRGQIPPVVPVESAKWDTARIPPHWSAPETLEHLSNASGNFMAGRFRLGNLETCWRIPEESLPVVQPFYSTGRFELKLDPVAEPGDRALIFSETKSNKDAWSEALAKGRSGRPVLLKIESLHDEVPTRSDDALVAAIARLVLELFSRKPSARIVSYDGDASNDAEPLLLKDIKILATKKELLAKLEHALQDVVEKVRVLDPSRFDSQMLNGGIFIDTPERAQGLDCKVSIIAHPLSGLASPGEFDLNTGRLSVMVSRHKVALFVVARDHVGHALEANLPNATQAPGMPDSIGEGHLQHVAFWNWFKNENQVVDLQIDSIA